MKRTHSRIMGFGRITATMEEVVGKKVRDYCVANKINLSKYLEDLAVKDLIEKGEIESREALQAEIEKYSM